MTLAGFFKLGAASCIVGGQWGSEAKGAAAAWTAYELSKKGLQFDIVTTNAGAQAGHTSIHRSTKRVVYHLPTAPLISIQEGMEAPIVYLNAGSIIDPEGLKEELLHNKIGNRFYIHPMAAVITDECKAAERDPTSAQTKIASTRKGVGEALSRKVLRSGMVARDHPWLKQFVRRMDLNAHMQNGRSVLVEVPQGVSLSLNHSKFYPHCTSRDCTTVSALSDAGIHPLFYNTSMVVLRTYPIRVGHIVEEGETLGTSGSHFPDQVETSWEELGVEAEITTVTKRIRRVFTFSVQQIMETMAICRPSVVFLSFCNYVKSEEQFDKIVNAIYASAKANWCPPPQIVYQWGATTADVGPKYGYGN